MRNRLARHHWCATPCGLALLGVVLHSWTASASCVGDCPPPDGQVSVNELVLGVGMALGTTALSACPDFDADGDTVVSVGEVVTAVNNAQLGCGRTPSPTPTPGGASPTPPRVGGTPATVTPTPSASPTSTWTAAPGPTITYFGVTSADDSLQPPSAFDPQNIPIYERPFGSGFKLVVEAAGDFSFGGRPTGVVLGGAPDLQIQATRPLGNGSGAVCDGASPSFGGVPAIDPPDLGNPDQIADALNDFGCRFIDGQGRPISRTCAEACIRYEDGDYHCKENATDYQFCAPIDMALTFPPGDTLLTVRVRDSNANLGPPSQLILRVP